jgi:peptidoglycan/LPS O-acetylase OafA/YrhL
MIFFYHWFFTEAESLPLLVRAPFDVGYVGVPIFFALSGFLITVHYYERFEKRRITFGKYLTRRLIRLYPLYFAILTLFVIAFGKPKTMIPQGVGAMIVTYTLTQALFPSLLLIGTAVGWTLTLEGMFYLAAPRLMQWLGRAASFSALLLRAVVVGLVTLVIGLLLARLPLAELLPDTLIGAPDTYILHYSLFGHLLDFLAGMVGGLLFLRRDISLQSSRHADTLIWIGVVGASISIVALDLIESELGSLLNRTLAFSVALFSSSLILGMASDSLRSNLVTRGLGSRLLVYLGKISYALFLIQLTEPCQWTYWILLGETLGVEDRILRAILLYVAATAMAAILYELIERPAHRWLSAQLTRV